MLGLVVTAACLSYIFGFKLFLEDQFTLMEAAELVDLVLVLATHFNLVTTGRLVVFGQL
jgi:hypothetical protein